MADYDSVDFFTDESLLEDPYPYFDHLRSKCPVLPTAHHGVVAVSGYEEASEIYLNNEDFSSCNSVVGPFATFPVPLEGDDIGEIIDGNRDLLPMNEHMVTMDPPDAHERAGADHAAADAEAAEGERGVHVAPGRPADRRVRRRRTLRVHQCVHPALRHARRWPTCSACPRRTTSASARASGSAWPPGKLGAERDGHDGQRARLARRHVRASTSRTAGRNPRDDVLTDLALATYPDGSTPDVANGRAHGDVPLRRRPGDDGPAAWPWA